MKVIALLLLMLFFFPVSFSQEKPIVKQKSNRIEKIIDAQWAFNYFPSSSANSGYEDPGYNDSGWQAVSIPHTWNTYETTREIHPFIRNSSELENPYWWLGWGWYRKHFSLGSDYTDKKIFVEFEGVQKYCKVWLNGKYVGEHKGGYGCFDFDLTSLIKYGEDNVLAVAVNNRQNDEFKILPMVPDSFDVYGGIYRNVKLVITDKLFIPMQGSASHEGGTFITTPGLSEKEGVVRVQTWVRNDNLLKKSCVLLSSITDADNKILQVIKSEAVINPGELYKFDQTSKLVRKPHLWSTEDPYLYKVNCQVLDGKTVVDAYTSPFGFRWFRWDEKDKSLYLNDKKIAIHGGIRYQDYPWLGDATPEWITEMDLRDMAENLNFNFLTSLYPNKGLLYDLADKYGIVTEEVCPGVKGQKFSTEVQEQQIKEMIRRDRNHPSIIFWNMGSETNNGINSEFVVNEDSTRILAACCIREDSTGALSSANVYTWLYEDHGAARDYPDSRLSHIDPSGSVDIYRVPKYSYYFWQANFKKDPMVFIQPEFWRSVYIGQKEKITVNSNCDTVELFVNGVSKGFLMPNQSNYHSVIFKDIVVEKGKISAIASKNGTQVKTEIAMAGEPAKIVLRGSQKKIVADRGSVVIITADIVDSQGIHVYDENNTVKWTLSGPATLVGPSVYESDINKVQEREGVGYMDMPVANIIRSTGKPGMIHVTLSASGLASGSYDIEADDTISDHSVIGEPVLEDNGRSKVVRILPVVNRSDEAPREIKIADEDFNLGLSDEKGYIRMMREYVFKNNPEADTSTVEFRTLCDLFSAQLLNSSGHLSAVDYNFNADHYNYCRLICGYVNSTRLPVAFKNGLKKYYSDAIIMKGVEKNAGEEMNWLNWIPSGGTVVIVQNEKNDPGLTGVIYSKSDQLEDIISAVYPQFVNFSKETKDRDFKFIRKINPYIQVTKGFPKDNEIQTSVSYTAEKGQPILIPLLKFISE
jgi:beta-galactosidase